jgi:hypothetical protein
MKVLFDARYQACAGGLKGHLCTKGLMQVPFENALRVRDDIFRDLSVSQAAHLAQARFCSNAKRALSDLSIRRQIVLLLKLIVPARVFGPKIPSAFSFKNCCQRSTSGPLSANFNVLIE